MRRTYVGLTVLALNIVAALAIHGCGGGDKGSAPPDVPALAQGPFVGADVCINCHSDTYSDWHGTKHAQALTTLIAHGQGTNPKCLVCHVVGYKQSTGFVDEATTPQLANVQCESCHGSGGYHITNPSSNKMPIPGSDTCCGCHTGTRHGQGDQWKTSAHAASLTKVLTHNPTSACLKCHSQEGYQNRDNTVVVPSSITAANGVTCVVCHDPHGGTTAQHQLVLEPLALCVSCHTNENAPLGTNPRHGSLYSGSRGYDATGAVLSGPDAPHVTQITDGCAGCHVSNVPNSAPSATNPVDHGHTFLAQVPAACISCHSEAEALAKKTATQAEFTTRLAALKRYLTSGTPQYINPTALSGAKLNSYNIAVYDYNLVVNDKSLGVHNGAYARALLDVSTSLFATLP